MKALALLVLCLGLLSLPVIALEETALPPMAGDMTSQPTDIGITGLLTLGGTYLVRKVMPEEKLRNRPHVLGWVSVATSILGGAIATYASGGGSVKPSEALLTALVGWLTAQGARRVKKLGGVS